MWRVQRRADDDLVILRVIGQLEREQLNELREVVASEGADRNVALDLKEVRLVDQDAVTFLAVCEANGTKLRNCPAYIREWIRRRQDTESNGRRSLRDVSPRLEQY
jgi:ABC-type transporter Mla MlaB component